MKKTLLYFGCIRQAGHYLWLNEQCSERYDQAARMIPGINPHLLQCLDGVFTPGETRNQGRYLESFVPPVRIVAWWDYSVDERGGCNSALIGHGFSSAEEMIDAAVIQFPSVMKRQDRPVPVNPTTANDLVTELQEARALLEASEAPFYKACEKLSSAITRAANQA